MNQPNLKLMNNNVRVCIFARVSSDRQNTERQISELRDYCKRKGWVVVEEIDTQVSGKSKVRLDLITLYTGIAAKAYDKILVSEISRLGRVKKVLQETINRCHENGISICFHNLGGMESLDDNGKETFVSNIIIAIYSELAAEELRMLTERSKSGQDKAKANGKHVGRPKGSVSSSGDLLRKHSKLASDIRKGLSLRQCMKIHDCSKNTVIRVKKILQ